MSHRILEQPLNVFGQNKSIDWIGEVVTSLLHEPQPFWQRAPISLQWHHMRVLASQITDNSTICLIAGSSSQQINHEISYWPFANTIKRSSVDSSRKRPVSRKIFPAIMSSWSSIAKRFTTLTYKVTPHSTIDNHQNIYIDVLITTRFHKISLTKNIPTNKKVFYIINGDKSRMSEIDESHTKHESFSWRHKRPLPSQSIDLIGWLIYALDRVEI